MSRSPDPSYALPTVTTSDLNRRLRSVIDRVTRGERFIVLCHKRPVATLQPLSGYVVQPLTGDVEDVTGRPVDPLVAELDELGEVQRRLLRDAISRGRVIPGNLGRDFSHEEVTRAMDDLRLRGLTKRLNRGTELTGRGMMFRDAVWREAGRGDPPY